MSAFWSLPSPCSDRCVALASGTETSPGTRATSPHLERRPGGWGGHKQSSPAPQAAARACSMLRTRLLDRTPAAPPTERLEFESPARHCGKSKILGRAWRVQVPPRAARCYSSVLVGNGNVSAPHGSCWRPSGATRNNWGWWPRWVSVGLWEGQRPCFPRGREFRLTSTVSACTWRWLPLAIDEKKFFSPSTVLPADPESQRDTTPSRAPDLVWDLGAHLCCQPVSGRVAGRGSIKPSQKGQVHLPTFSPVGLAPCLNLPASPAVKWDNRTTSRQDYGKCMRECRVVVGLLFYCPLPTQRAASLSGRRTVGAGATWLLLPPRALHPICCQRREVSDYPSGNLQSVPSSFPLNLET